MKQNQRKTQVFVDKENREKDDFYPTDPAAVTALLSVEKFDGAIWECACGDGAISKILQARGHEVISTDLVDRGYGESRVDFLMEYTPRAPNIITNPPFKLSTEFMRKGLELSTGKFCMLLRLACLEGKERAEIFKSSPLARVWVFSKRITMHRNGEKTGESNGMIAFAWFVWEHGHSGRPEIGWL